MTGDFGKPQPQAPAPWGPDLEPTPVEGCDVCAALVGQREQARRSIGALSVRECNRELRAHPHRRSGDWR